MSTDLRIFLTVDVGPADAVIGRGRDIESDWTRTDRGLASLRDVLRSIEDQTGLDVRATWFLRADGLVGRQFGTCAAIVEKFLTQQAGLIDAGHEVGWMPQLYSSDDRGVAYDDLLRTHEAIRKTGLVLSCVRMGECFHDNRTMAILDELGIAVDSSALPGREKVDLGWRMNWIGTPTEPYHPSTEDYRKPGTSRLSILEVPLSVRTVMAPYDSVPILRYVNPCMQRRFFAQNLPELISSASFLVMVLHPDEIIPISGEGHPLVAYSADELRHNLGELIQMANDRSLSFGRLDQFVSAVPSS